MFTLTSPVILNLTIGIVVSSILAYLSVRGRSLSPSGGIGAAIIGTLIFGYGGWTWFVVLLSFFVSSSLLTRFRYSVKNAKGVAEMKVGARSIWQTIGQGGVAAMVAGFGLVSTSVPVAMAVCFVASLAEANADTWAAELGVLSKQNPRRITSLSSEVATGTSGGVSVLGELSAVAGAFLVSLLALVLGVFGGFSAVPLLIVVGAAVLGEHVDSVLGGTIQAAYHCSKCEKETERRIHKCGTMTKHVKGIAQVNNEAVNLLSTGFAAASGLILYLVL
jgi:uncharacterized protein (TIGR00297 family)